MWPSGPAARAGGCDRTGAYFDADSSEADEPDEEACDGDWFAGEGDSSAEAGGTAGGGIVAAAVGARRDGARNGRFELRARTYGIRAASGDTL